MVTPMKEAIAKASGLIEAMPYIRAFQHKTVVIKFGGSAMVDDATLTDVLEDIVFMQLVGIKPVLVHGGGPFISEEMTKRGKEPVFVDGHRTTDAETLEIAVDVLANRVNRAIVDKLKELGGCAVPGWRPDQGHLQAEKQFMQKTDEQGDTRQIDFGLVGKVVHVDAAWLGRTCEDGTIPVLPPSGVGADGQFLNIQADTVAAEVAVALSAEKLVFLSNTHGIMKEPPNEDSLVSSLHESEVEDLVARGVIGGGMLPKARACISVLRGGVRKAHIIDGTRPHSLLLEIFTDKGVGTEIVV